MLQKFIFVLQKCTNFAKVYKFWLALLVVVVVEVVAVVIVVIVVLHSLQTRTNQQSVRVCVNACVYMYTCVYVCVRPCCDEDTFCHAAYDQAENPRRDQGGPDTGGRQRQRSSGESEERSGGGPTPVADKDSATYPTKGPRNRWRDRGA